MEGVQPERVRMAEAAMIQLPKIALAAQGIAMTHPWTRGVGPSVCADVPEAPAPRVEGCALEPAGRAALGAVRWGVSKRDSDCLSGDRRRPGGEEVPGGDSLNEEEINA